MFCTKCGKSNTDDAVFCSGCGAPMANTTKKSSSAPQAQTAPQAITQSQKNSSNKTILLAIVITFLATACIAMGIYLFFLRGSDSPSGGSVDTEKETSNETVTKYSSPEDLVEYCFSLINEKDPEGIIGLMHDDILEYISKEDDYSSVKEFKNDFITMLEEEFENMDDEIGKGWSVDFDIMEIEDESDDVYDIREDLNNAGYNINVQDYKYVAGIISFKDSRGNILDSDDWEIYVIKVDNEWFIMFDF